MFSSIPAARNKYAGLGRSTASAVPLVSWYSQDFFVMAGYRLQFKKSRTIVKSSKDTQKKIITIIFGGKIEKGSTTANVLAADNATAT